MSIADFLMGRLKQKNPQGYQFIQQVRQSGRDPGDVLKEMYAKGQINDSQLNTIQRQGRMFGINIPQDEIAKIKSSKTQPKNVQNGKFGGWF